MDEIPLSLLFITLVVLLALSAFFSASETSMMAVNRYRLRHRAQAGQRGARLAEGLLARTDKMLATILIGSNLVNAAAASLVTLIAFRMFGQDEWALTLATLAVTFLILVFSEVTPKVTAAVHADRLAPLFSYPLGLLQRLFAPVAWFVNLFVRALIVLLRIPIADSSANRMGVEELRTLLAESGAFLPAEHRGILLNLLDLEKIEVDDVMRPRGQINGIDLDDDDDAIERQLRNSPHDALPVFAADMNALRGIIQVRRALDRFRAASFDRDVLLGMMREPYFIPSGTPLLTQLAQFRHTRHRMGLVVDEYGELLGLVTLVDLLEEIVGEFAIGDPLEGSSWLRQPDGSYLVEGSASLRELNRKLGLDLPLEHARTLNGLILEHLEAMPEPDLTLKISGYPMELVQVQERMVKTARLFPRLTPREG